MRRLSLRGRLFLLLVGPLVLVSLAAAAGRYVMAERLSERLYDNTLMTAALTISRDVMLSQGDVLTGALLKALTDSLGDPVYYRITGPGGGFVTGYSEPPPPPPGPVSDGPLFYDSVAQGRPVRVVRLREHIADPLSGGWVTVEVWQTVTQRAALSLELLAQSAMLMGALVSTAAAVLWFGIGLGLKPLRDLREAVAARSEDDLRPLRAPAPVELRPLIDTANSLFARLAQALAIRDAFISDAAHQLRNPVAAILAQAEAALGAPDEATRRRRVARLVETARGAGRLTNQLLSIERIRGRTLRRRAAETDIAALVTEHVRRFAEGQLRRDIAVGLAVRGQPRRVVVDAVMIAEMLENILDNAATHGAAPGGAIAVDLEFSPAEVLIRVADDGPGVPLAHRQRVFDRFFRLADEATRGCGLGLAIVSDVAAAHGGVARMADSAAGARVEVALPC